MGGTVGGQVGGDHGDIVVAVVQDFERGARASVAVLGWGGGQCVIAKMVPNI